MKKPNQHLKKNNAGPENAGGNLPSKDSGASVTLPVSEDQKSNAQDKIYSGLQYVRRLSTTTPLVSIVVPVYNVEQFVIKCLASIAQQTYQNYEVIMVNDGSTDSSALICEEFSKLDNRFKLYHKQNGGLGSARNFGLQYVNGSYLTFLDSDDFYEPEAIAQMVALMLGGCDMVVASFDLVRDDGRLIETRELGKFYGEKSTVRQVLTSNAECYAWNKMYRAEVFINNPRNRYAETWFEDLAITPALIAASKKIGFVSRPLINYVQREGSIIAQSKTNSERQVEVFDAFGLLKEKRKLFEDADWDAYVEWMLPKHLFIWRIDALHSDPIHERRAPNMIKFSKRLNSEFPGWDTTAGIEHWLSSSPDERSRNLRKLIIKAYRLSAMGLYSKLKEVANLGI